MPNAKATNAQTLKLSNQLRVEQRVLEQYQYRNARIVLDEAQKRISDQIEYRDKARSALIEHLR